MRTLKIPAVISLACICLFPTASNVMGSLAPGIIPDFQRIQQPPVPDVIVKEGVVKSGETISQILDPYLPLKSVYAINRDSRSVFSLERIRPGRPYRIFTESGLMTRFEYDITNQCRLLIQRKDGGFSITKAPIAHTFELKLVSGTITTSLYWAILKAGETGELAQRLAAIFAWDIDFIRDIRPGDRFSLLVEKRYHRKAFSGYGHIRAARFDNRGETYQAFWHRGENGCCGYYDADGRSLAKAFLKSPLDYSRISSGFNLKRMHPVLKEVRPHPAVDYAAPEGTPIKAVGDGVVTAMGYSRTMGNHVTLRHAGGYKTRYFHMSGFARGLARGSEVSQGRIIGFVGQTGYATGPHLCFRMTVNGRPVDPLGPNLPSADPVSRDELDAFQANASELAGRLDFLAESVQYAGIP
ncbi:MAG: peptidoglycan DD-metalloendopeptidase family protein [Desulfobacterales bacterium]|nr:peptidoglycan DD-metalloendopeptidase family protein [Desulfobacterales bacterium]